MTDIEITRDDEIAAAKVTAEPSRQPWLEQAFARHRAEATREKDAEIARLREEIVRINNLSKNLCSMAENAVLTVGLELHKATRTALKEHDDGQ